MNATLLVDDSAGSRSARERAFWDGTYNPRGVNHHRYVWVKGVENRSHIGDCFSRALSGLRGKRVLSLGGGLDHVAVTLAQAGNRVVSVDISPVAAVRTGELAAQFAVAEYVTTKTANCEELRFQEGEFDVVVCKRALHHMDLAKVLAGAHYALAPGGAFLAEEPICLSRVFRWLHARFPFAPEAPRTPDERELTEREFALLRQTFRKVRVRYFDFLARESVAYFLSKAHLVGLLKPLGKFDDFLMNRCFPALKGFATYALIEAVK
jgi:SAM-dependent methyltransferase